MQNMILKIFDKVNMEISDLAETEKDLEEEVGAVLEMVQNQIPKEYYNEIDRRLFEVAGMAERKGFELGMKYMAKLLMECLS